jgi:trk system potassium uptake protein TrkH
MKSLNFKIILSILGLATMLNGLFMLLAVPFSVYHQENAAKGILTAGILTVFFGFLLWFFNRNSSKNLGKKEGYMIVTFGWVILALTGTLPYLFTNSIHTFTDAFFETMSGYSTTGASIVNNIEALPKGILFWRSATHWIGGMGIIVLTIAILPLLGIGGMQLFMAEAPGITYDKLHPRITETAKRLWLIYFGLTMAEFLLLKLAGMTWFDAINHAMSTMSTGGFSTKNASLAHWNHAPLIQYIVIFFMFVAGTNFVLTYFILKGNFKKAANNEEFKYYLTGLIGISFLVTILILFYQDPNLKTTIIDLKPHGEVESAIRHALFQVVAILTTTGFVSADFTMWNSFATILIFSLFLIGGSAGSTAGGVKIVRHLIIIKNSLLEIKKLLHPNAIIRVRYDQKSVHQHIVFNIISFFVLYMLIFILGSIILTFFGLDFISSMSASASSLSNVGPALGSVSPVNNYAHLTDHAKLFCSFLMLIGRLELFTVLVLFTPYFWKKN